MPYTVRVYVTKKNIHAAARGRGLKYLIGKGLGILRAAGDEAPEPRALTVQAQGVPRRRR